MALVAPPTKLLRNLIKQQTLGRSEEGQMIECSYFCFFLIYPGNSDQIKVKIRLDRMSGWK